MCVKNMYYSILEPKLGSGDVCNFTKDVETNVLHRINQIFIKIQNSNFVQFLEHQLDQLDSHVFQCSYEIIF